MIYQSEDPMLTALCRPGHTFYVMVDCMNVYNDEQTSKESFAGARLSELVSSTVAS